MAPVNNPPRRSGKGWLFLLLSIAFVFGAWGTWFHLTKSAWGEDTHETELLTKFGQFGDTFGSLNTLFAGLAFTGVVYTIYRQQADGREADARHADTIKAEERIALINGHTATLHYVQDEVRRSDERQMLISRIRAKFSTISRFSLVPSGPFLMQATQLKDAEELLMLVNHLIGTVSSVETWDMVAARVHHYLQADEEGARQHIVKCRAMQDHAIEEIKALTEQVKRQSERS